MYRARTVILGIFLIQEGQNDGLCVRRLKRLKERVAETSGSVLSRHGGRVGDAARQMTGALLAPHIDPQSIKRFSRGKSNEEGW